MALVGVRVDEPPGTPERFGRRSAARETQAVLAAITGVLRPVDRAVRLADNEYLLMLPALDRDGGAGGGGPGARGGRGLARSYPFVAFTVHAAVTVTDRRPLPLADVRHAVEWAVREGVPVATLAARSRRGQASSSAHRSPGPRWCASARIGVRASTTGQRRWSRTSAGRPAQ